MEGPPPPHQFPAGRLTYDQSVYGLIEAAEALDFLVLAGDAGLRYVLTIGGLCLHAASSSPEHPHGTVRTFSFALRGTAWRQLSLARRHRLLADFNAQRPAAAAARTVASLTALSRPVTLQQQADRFRLAEAAGAWILAMVLTGAASCRRAEDTKEPQRVAKRFAQAVARLAAYVKPGLSPVLILGDAGNKQPGTTGMAAAAPSSALEAALGQTLLVAPGK